MRCILCIYAKLFDNMLSFPIIVYIVPKRCVCVSGGGAVRSKYIFMFIFTIVKTTVQKNGGWVLHVFLKRINSYSFSL